MLEKSDVLSTVAREARRTTMRKAAADFVFVLGIHCATRNAAFSNRMDRKDSGWEVGKGITKDK